MELTTKELLAITKILMKYVEDIGYGKISFSTEDSYYQKVWHEDRNVYGQPPISLGYIEEDIEALKKLLSSNKEEAIPTAYDLQRLGAVLTTLGAVMTK